MKKFYIALIVLSPVFCFGAFTESDFTNIFRVQIYTFSDFGVSNFTYSSQASLTPDTVPTVYYSSVNGIRFSDSVYRIYQPSFPSDVPTNSICTVGNISYPIQGSTIYSSSRSFWPIAAFSKVRELYVLVTRLYASGYRGSGFKNIYTSSGNLSSGNVCLNFYYPDLVADIMSSTNSVFQSLLLSHLNSISSNIQNIRVDLGQFQTDYQYVNWDSLNFLDFVDGAVYNGSFTFSHGQYLKDTYNSFVNAGENSSAAAFKSAVLQQFRNNNLMSDASTWLNNNSNNPSVQSALRSAGDSFGAGAAYHYTTPLTNEMRRMNADWVNETKAALSNNTQKIKDDLAAWKNQLHGTQTSIDNSAANINNTLNNIAGGSSVVRVNVQNQDIGVTITDPVTIDPTQFNAFSEDLGKAGDYMERLFNEFKWWAWDSPDSWKKGFLDRDLAHVSSNIQFEVSLLQSLTNFLADSLIAVTSNVYQVSNDFASAALLLDDYETFIDSSKYNDIISSLPPDLSSSLSSFGFSDSSEYSGRWWAFITANSAYQSTLLSTNAALASTLLSALEQIDDDDEGSLLSRWLSLIRSLPDPEELQIMLCDASNIVSNVGFDRVDSFYNTVTSDFANVTKNVFRDKSLPSVLSLTYLPAIDGREAKVVEIPVGEHSSLWSLFRGGMAFAISVVTLILFPKYLIWLLTHYISLVQRVIRSLHAYTHS